MDVSQLSFWPHLRRAGESRDSKINKIEKFELYENVIARDSGSWPGKTNTGHPI